MERKTFIKTCGFACLGGIGMSTLLSACSTLNTLSGNLSDSDLIVPISHFETHAGTETHYKKYIILHQEQLRFPICVYRFDEKNYTALWMECSHLGAELQVFGDKLQCPAHGSEFSNKGAVQNGPADNALRSFPVLVEANQLKISLKAV